MSQWQSTGRWSGTTAPPLWAKESVAERLRPIADFGLIATICVAPFVFGGRHDLGRLAFVACVAITAVAWFVRQAIEPEARWTRTAAHAVLLAALGLVTLQIVPLPPAWIEWLSPRTTELLPLWTGHGDNAVLGVWNTLSLTPADTKLGLATLVAYGLLFVVVCQRIAVVEDAQRVLQWVAMAAVLMAGFGIVQFFTSNGRYFWFYEHPYRTTEHYATGSFMNRNHFASFLVMGIGPLVAWLLATLRASSGSRRARPLPATAHLPTILLVAAILVVMVSVALSQSRGGSLALVVALFVLTAIYWRWRLVDGRYMGGLVAIGVAMLGLLSIYGYDEWAARMDDLAGGSVESVDQDSGRRLIWAANVEAIRGGGMTGAGVGSHLELSPVYLEASLNRHYTHAENGYLQIATEAGIAGMTLLAAGIALVAWWCVACFRNLGHRPEQLCFGAAAAGLAASLAHSLVDFVWFIPATMSIAIVLAACTLRLAQFALPEARLEAVRPVLRRACWIEMSAVVTLLGAWMVHAYVAPAMGSLAWDRYLLAEIANNRLMRQDWTAIVAESEPVDAKEKQDFAARMLRHLDDTISWNPNSSLAYFESAQRALDLFELRQRDSANALGVAQIADAVAASRFESADAIRAWLKTALGENAELLYRAQAHARRSVAICPLHGEAYVLLANLDFLDSGPRPSVEQLARQGLSVRPRQGAVLFELGRQRLIAGDIGTALQFWAHCANNPGPHQLRIVHTLAGGMMPAAEYVKILQPDWQTLREVWLRYKQQGRPEDLNQLVVYAQQLTDVKSVQLNGEALARIWYSQFRLYNELQRRPEALACLEKAYQAGPQLLAVRYSIAQLLMADGRYAEAEPHVRWCLARRPDDKTLSGALVEIAKQRFAQHTPGNSK